MKRGPIGVLRSGDGEGEGNDEGEDEAIGFNPV